MRFTPQQRTLFLEARRHMPAVLEMPGAFFVVPLESGRYVGWGEGYQVYCDRGPGSAVYSPDEADPTNKVIHIMRLTYKEIHHPCGKWLLWAERPEEHVDKVIEAMIEVLRDNGWEPKNPRFWPAVMATLIARQGAT